MTLLDIQNLTVEVEGKTIVHELNLKVGAGEVHILMGPNGSGKSSLAMALMGHPKYKIVTGEASLDGKDLLKMSPNERVVQGLFLGFQYPKEIPGVTWASFLRASTNAVKKARAKRDGLDFQPIPLFRFKKMLGEFLKDLKLPTAFLNRSTHEGFSGGEKKKSELLQMMLLEPRIAILDETDSGLDIDALKQMGEWISKHKKPEQSLLLITHNPRVLRALKPDRIHVLLEGKIAKSGGPELASSLEKEGFDQIREHAGLNSSGLNGKKSGLQVFQSS